MKEIKDYSLLPHNTFGMDVKASLFVEYESVTELQSILSDKKLMAGNWLHIGGGSNLLFKGDYAGTVLHSAIRGYEVVAENEQEIEVRAGAGEVWDDFGIDDVQYARNHVVPLRFIVEIVAKRLCLGRVYLPLIYPVDYSFRFFGDVSDK